MTETISPRRQRRPITAPAESGQVQAGSAAVMAPGPGAALPATFPSTGNAEFDAYLATLREISHRRQYRLAGRLARAQVYRDGAAKTIDFRKEGPVIGFANGTDQQMIVISEWNGIPAKWDDTDEFCNDCLTACDVCDGNGEKNCEAFKCGGRGQVTKPSVPCPAIDCLNGQGSGAARPKSGCSMCRGTGMYEELIPCQVCKGTGRARCSVCRGTGKRPTGIAGGETDPKKPACQSCRGSKFAHKEIPQELEQFTSARLGSFLVLGPIIRFVIESVGGTGESPIMFDVDADQNGQYLALVLESDQPGAGVFLVGGVLRAVTRL